MRIAVAGCCNLSFGVQNLDADCQTRARESALQERMRPASCGLATRKTGKPSKSFELPAYTKDSYDDDVYGPTQCNGRAGDPAKSLLPAERMGRLLNHWLSAVIAERARQADNIVLRHLSDRELKDIGLTRGDFGEGLAEADRSRIRMQRSKRSKRS